MTGEFALHVDGLEAARRAFREAGGKTRDLSAAHRQVAKVIEPRARDAARSGTAQQAKAAGALLGKGSAREAVLAIRNTGRVPFGIGAFMGALAYPQFPQWVGSAWNVDAGEGPYAVTPAIRSARPEVEEAFRRTVGDLFESAGFEVT